MIDLVFVILGVVCAVTAGDHLHGETREEILAFNSRKDLQRFQALQMLGFMLILAGGWTCIFMVSHNPVATKVSQRERNICRCHSFLPDGQRASRFA